MVASKSRPGPINLHSFISALIGITYRTESVRRKSIGSVLKTGRFFQISNGWKGPAHRKPRFFPGISSLSYRLSYIDFPLNEFWKISSPSLCPASLQCTSLCTGQNGLSYISLMQIFQVTNLYDDHIYI